MLHGSVAFVGCKMITDSTAQSFVFAGIPNAREHFGQPLGVVYDYVRARFYNAPLVFTIPQPWFDEEVPHLGSERDIGPTCTTCEYHEVSTTTSTPIPPLPNPI